MGPRAWRHEPALRLAPWSVRSARTAEEDDELPLHAALAAGAEHALVRRLLAVDPGGAFVKDAAGALPLHVALRAAAAPATVEALLLLFPESSAKRGGDGLTPAQLAAHYEEAAEEEAVAALVRGARAEVRRNAEKLRRKAQPRAIERVALRGGGGRARGDRAADRGLGLRARKARFCPRARDETTRVAAGFGRRERSANRRRRARAAGAKLFEGEAREASARSGGGGKKMRGRERRALRRGGAPRGAPLRCSAFSPRAMASRSGAAHGAAALVAFGGQAVTLAPRLAAFRRERVSARENLAREASAPFGATPNADSALARKRVHPNPASVPAAPRARASKPEPSVPAGLDGVPTAEAADVPEPAPVRCSPRSWCASTRRSEK